MHVLHVNTCQFNCKCGCNFQHQVLGDDPLDFGFRISRQKGSGQGFTRFEHKGYVAKPGLQNKTAGSISMGRRNITVAAIFTLCASARFVTRHATSQTTWQCGRGGTGRRAALRSLWDNIPWKFESSRPHHFRQLLSFNPPHSVCGWAWSSNILHEKCVKKSSPNISKPTQKKIILKTKNKR